MKQNINISNYKNIYFIGIGGIGMSALAKYFAINKKNIAGYDKTPSVITKKLENLKIIVSFEDKILNIPELFLDKTKTLIVYTPAIPKTHKQLLFFKNNDFLILKRAEILGLITKKTFCFAIAGTHGKTTTTAILGHILKESGVNATTFLGGIATNYNSNLILGDNKISVVEADEYDKSFLELSPNIACITSTDADHLDIYKEKNTLKKTFNKFANLVEEKLFVKYGINIAGTTFGLEQEADYQAKNIKNKNGTTSFSVKTPTEKSYNITIQLLGNHNILNALVALAMANNYGVPLTKIKKALANFKGIERRFNIKINTKNFVLIDDYAHHPTEINAVYNTIKDLYSNKEKIVVFQPHLFSRTRDFADNFALSLGQFNKVILLEIYPARELPINGITSNWLAEKIQKTNKNTIVVKNTSEIIKNIPINNTVLTILGAGDIGKKTNKITKEINKKLLVKNDKI